MRAVGYFREMGAAERGEPSLAEQSKTFLEFCHDRGYEVVASFVDGSAAAEQRRPGFQQLVEFLRRPEKGFLMVVTPSINSLGRDLKEAARSWFELQGLGAQVLTMDGGDDATGLLLQAWSKNSESRPGDKVRSAMRRKAVKGEVLGRPPYGYRVGSRRRLELVPEEAVVVRYIYRLYLQEGLGIRRIARCLNEEGLKTRRGGNWSMVSIRDILRNRAYLGTYSRFGVRVPGSHPALISPDDFRRVQDCLMARRSSYSTPQASPFLLSGLAYCGYCGNKMIGVSRRQSWKRQKDGSVAEASYRYYQCQSRTNQSLCDYHTHRADDLDGEVRQTLSTLDLSAGRAFRQAGDQEAVLSEAKEECRELRRRLALLDKRLERHLDAAARGRLSREKLQSLGLALAAERLDVEARLVATERRVEEQASVAVRRRAQEEALLRLCERWDSLDFPSRRSLVRDVVDRIIVADDGIKVQLRP
ncbi:MAG TPA: recombinase family protein [Dehalococcoidia bacterium]|nr:recombinase family protein [Dehalococcoidia bacterium]